MVIPLFKILALPRVTGEIKMKPSTKRSVKSAQVQMREIVVKIDGTAGTPAASGFDASQISSVVDNGTGDYTIILKKPFNKDNSNLPICLVQSITSNIVTEFTSSAYDRVTVKSYDDAGLAADADLVLVIKGCDHRFNY